MPRKLDAMAEIKPAYLITGDDEAKIVRTRERLRALKRIIPRTRAEDALDRNGRDRAHFPSLSGWSLVWFVIALGLFCRDCFRQVFRWL